jgi:hypothetical protein|tara:strand:- start:5848 stop:6510 length:663 start_codon:yes stop_codon:yes gene_type:complete
MMKLSDKTVGILKNFSTINQNILIKEGSKLRTMSTMKNILAEANVSEAFPADFGIYDLNEFLGVLTLAKDADLNFDNQAFLTANSGPTKIKYMYSDPSILTVPPETFNAPETDVDFSVPQDILANLLKASAVMQLPDITIVSNGNPGVEVTATDLKNTSSNNYIQVLDIDRQPFECRFKAENLKMISGDYEVHVSTTTGVSHWVGTDVSYWIAMEAKTDG